MAQQTLLGGDGTTGETGATHNNKANSNFTELYAATAAAQADANDALGDISTHVSASPAHAATAVSVTPFGTIGSTDVQSALEEIAAEAGAVTIPDASETTEGVAELATQSEANTGTDDARIVTPLKIKNLDKSASALTDASSMALTAPKHTLTTSSATRTFTITHTGDEIDLLVILNATSSVFTFPAAALCVSEGIASGDNTLSIGGTSGDRYAIGIKKIGSVYIVLCKNIGQ